MTSIGRPRLFPFFFPVWGRVVGVVTLLKKSPHACLESCVELWCLSLVYTSWWLVTASKTQPGWYSQDQPEKPKTNHFSGGFGLVLGLFKQVCNQCQIQASFQIQWLWWLSKDSFQRVVGRWNPSTFNTPFFFKPWTSQLVRLTRAKTILILPSKKNVLTVQPLPSDIKWYTVEFKGGFFASSFPWSPRDTFTMMIWLTMFANIAIRISVPQKLIPISVYSSLWPRTASDYVTPGGFGKLSWR